MHKNFAKTARESVGAHFTQGKWRSLVVVELLAATSENEHALDDHTV